MECNQKRKSPYCGVACQGLYADVTKRWKNGSLRKYIFPREVADEKEQSDAVKLMTMKQEYERYKDQWGLNLQYSHSAGPTKNYSELYLVMCKISTF